MGAGDAVRALRRLIADPEDTSQVFRIVEALSGSTGERLRGRLKRSSDGRRLLRERPSLLELIQDREYLRGLPEGSLGRAYLSFLEAEGISAEGLVDASERGYGGREQTDEEVFVSSRMRDSHDLWHVVTGYHGDLIGEVSLLAFTFAQTRNLGVGLIVLAGLLKAPNPDTRRLIIAGFLRGRRASWLPAAPWERLLDRPLSEVRAELGIGDPPAYEPVRTSDLDEPIRLF